MTTPLQDQLWRAWACSVPLVAVTTADPEATQRLVTELAESKQRPAIRWDPATGYLALTEAGDRLIQSKFPTPEILDPLAALQALRSLPEFSLALIYCLTPDAFWERPTVLQATWNLRPLFSRGNKMAVFICPPSLRLPTALQHDILVLNQSLPTEAELQQLARGLYLDNGLPEPEEPLLNKAGAMLRGLAPFDAQQAAALSMTEQGLNLQSLSQRKRQFVRNIRGLTISEEPITFTDIGGLESVKRYNEKLFRGPEPPSAVVVVDEMEKLLAGSAGDLSGISQDQLAVLLSYMQGNEWFGQIFVGVPGSGKTLIASALAHSFGVIGLRFDLGATKEGIVGSSESNIRTVMQTLEAIAGKRRVLFVATMNKITDAIPAPLQRRYPTKWYFDLPDLVEKTVIWQIHLRRYGFDKQSWWPSDELLNEALTGSDIYTICDTAWKLGLSSLEDAREEIIPVAIADPEGLAQLRQSVSRRFRSASRPGSYIYSDSLTTASGGENKRKLQFH